MRTPYRFSGASAALAVGLAAGLLVGAAPRARAQARTDPRWDAWIGCWAPTAAKQLQQGAGANALLVCVIPAAGSDGVDVATVADTQVVSRERLEANGERRAVERDGCSGWESAQWSAQGARVYVRSELSCQGNLRRRSNGVMALSAEGEWLDVRSATAGTRSGVRVLRYHSAPLPETLPADVAAALRGGTRAVSGPATSDLALADVADASRALDANVVAAWLAETGQDFGMDARRLSEARRDGIPGDVIDVMVALSYPRVFTVNPATPQPEFRRPAEGEVSGYGSARPDYGYGWGGYYYSPYGWDSWWPYGFGPYSSWYSPYGAYGYSPWYGGYGGWYGGWYYGGGGGVFILPGSSGTAINHGQVVKGRGYTQGGGDTGRSAHPRGQDGSPRYVGSGDRSRSSGGSAQPSSGGAQPRAQPSSGGSQPRAQPSSGGSQPSSGSGGGRTAKPRNPGR